MLHLGQPRWIQNSRLDTQHKCKALKHIGTWTNYFLSKRENVQILIWTSSNKWLILFKMIVTKLGELKM